jgi:hypothetical protein
MRSRLAIRLRNLIRISACAIVAVVLPNATERIAAAPLLPDLFAWEDETRCYMHCGRMDIETIDNKVLYKFTGALPNIGAGRLEIRDVTLNNVQDIYQRIYQTEGGFTETLIGSFPITGPLMPGHHLFLPGIAQYNLRTVLAGNGVGPVVRSNDKTSMAVVDSNSYDTSLQGAPTSRYYDSVSDPILGISIGWADVYGSNLPGQWIEVTGLADGEYWLEVIANPYGQDGEGRIVESDYSNNTTRIKVNLVVPEPQILPGDYNGDDSVDAADYVVWRKTLGQNVPLGSRADGNGDGMINPADYDVWRTNFGITRTGGGASHLAAPEPSGTILSMLGLALLLIPRVGRRRRE